MTDLWNSEQEHIRRCAAEVRAAKAELERARERLDDALAAAVVGANRAEVKQVAQAAGVSRQTVYSALDRTSRQQQTTTP